MKSSAGCRPDVLLRTRQNEKLRGGTCNHLLAKMASCLPSATGNELTQTSIVSQSLAYFMEIQIKWQHQTGATLQHHTSKCQEKNSFSLRAISGEEDHTVTYISDQVIQLLGFNQVDVMGRFLFDMIFCDLLHIQTMIDDGSRSGRSDFHATLDLKSKASTKRNHFIARTVIISGQFMKLDKGQGQNSLYLNALVEFPPSFGPKDQMPIVAFQSFHSLVGSFINSDDSITIITGFSSSEVIGQSAFRYIFQEDQTQVFQDLMVQLGEMTTVTYQLVTKNGTSIYLQTQGSPIFDHDGTISQYHCENQINEEEEALRQIDTLGIKLESMHIANNETISDSLDYFSIDSIESLYDEDIIFDLSLIEPSISLIDEFTFNLLMSDEDLVCISRHT